MALVKSRNDEEFASDEECLIEVGCGISRKPVIHCSVLSKTLLENVSKKLLDTSLAMIMFCQF